MPVRTRGHDVKKATIILASISDISFREELVNTANRFITYDTTTVERVYILQGLAKFELNNLKEMDKANKKVRAVFIKLTVPTDLKDGDRLAYVSDEVLNTQWKI